MSELTYAEVWETLSKVDVSAHTEEKMGLTYLSWSRMWMLMCEHYPQAQYEFVLFDGVPYKTLPDGTAEVYTFIKIDNLIRSMKLPVMDHKNKPVVNPHARQVNDNAMRCLVKNAFMFGLGIKVFANMPDDTLPDKDKDEQPKGKKTPTKKAEPKTAEVKEDRKTVLAEDEPQEDGVKDEAWAEAFVEGFLKVSETFEFKEEVRAFYKTNSDINVLKDKFPKHKEALDESIVTINNSKPSREESTEEKKDGE